MPLLKQNVFLLAEPPEHLAPDESVFQVRFTKEIFRDYDEYVKRMNLYRQKIWTCKATGRENLTYEKALVSELRASQKAEFPKDFMGPVLHLVQFSELELDELVEEIFNTLSNRFVVGEEVSILKEDAASRGRVLQVQEEGSGETKRMRYEVGWFGAEGLITQKTVEDSSSLAQRNLPFTKAALKKFIQESAYGEVSLDMPWLVRDKLARKFKIPFSPPGEEKQVHSRQDNQRQVNQAYFDESLDDIEAEYNARKRSNKRYRDSASSKSSRSKSRKNDGSTSPNQGPELIDDNLLEPCHEDAPLPERPPPCSDFKVEPDCVGSLLMVWDFCNSFAKVLQLSEFSLYDFERALQYTEGESMLLSEAYYSIFRLVICEPGVKQRLAQRRKKKVHLSIDAWKDELSDYLELEGPEKLKPYMQAVRGNSYWQLATSSKLEIFEELIERALSTTAVRNQLDENIESHEALCAEKRDEPLGSTRKKNSRHSERSSEATEEQASPHCVSTGGDPYENGCLIRWLKKGRRTASSAHETSDGATVKREYSARCLFFNTSRQTVWSNRVALEEERYPEVKTDRNDQPQTPAPQQKKMEQLDRELEKCFIRTAPLGKDRSYNRYWFFHREGRIFVESEDSKSWGFYSAKKELDDLCDSLNPKGAREHGLKEQLGSAYNRIRYVSWTLWQGWVQDAGLLVSSSMQKRSKDLAQRLALEEANPRRSLRVQSAPRPTGHLAYVNKCRNNC